MNYQMILSLGEAITNLAEEAINRGYDFVDTVTYVTTNLIQEFFCGPINYDQILRLVWNTLDQAEIFPKTWYRYIYC